MLTGGGCGFVRRELREGLFELLDGVGWGGLGVDA